MEMDQRRIEVLKQDFPDGLLPDGLIDFLNLGLRDGGWVACEFVVSDVLGATVVRWFDDDEDMMDKFAAIGRDRARSLYGFWFHDGTTSATAPIVVLDANKQHNHVVANSLPEFIALLTLGLREPGMVHRWDELSREPPCDDVGPLREWAKQTFGIDVPKDPRAIVDTAQKAHPSLQEWIDAWKGGR